MLMRLSVAAGARTNAPPAFPPAPGPIAHADARPRRGRTADARANAPPAVRPVPGLDAHVDAPLHRGHVANVRIDAPPAVRPVPDPEAYSAPPRRGRAAGARANLPSPRRRAASARGNAPPAVRQIADFDAHVDAPSPSHRAADAREIALSVIHRTVPETAPMNTNRDPRRTIRSDLQRVANISAKYLTKRRLQETSLSVGNVISE